MEISDLRVLCSSSRSTAKSWAWDETMPHSGYMEMCALVESGVVSSYMPPVVHIATSEFLPTLRWEGNCHLKFEDYDHS